MYYTDVRPTGLCGWDGAVLWCFWRPS